MATLLERRSAARLALAEPLAGQVSPSLEMRLLDISTTGARFTHLTLLRPGVTYVLRLPPALGSLALSVRVIRSRVIGQERRPTEARTLRYESGVVFLGLTEAQRATLRGLIAQCAVHRKAPVEIPPDRSETNGGSPS